VKCPECNAALEATAETQEVRCAYCGTLAQIQRRTRFLQRPAPLPPRPPEAPAAKVATEGRSLSVGVMVGVLVPVVFFVGLPVLLCNLDWTTPYGVTVLADVDGDGADDLVSVMRERESEAMHLAAFDGQSGKLLWRSDEIRQGTSLGILCAAKGVVIESDKGASLNGINLADGELRWHVRLDEAVERLCAGDDASTVRVVRKDKRAHLISLSDGALRPASAAGTCGPLRCDRPFGRRGRDLHHREQQRWQAALPGMKVEKVVEWGATTLALGHKTPGSSVPMIASVRPPRRPGKVARARSGDFTGGHGQAGAPEVLWRTVVPATTPLSVKGGTPRPKDVAVSDKAVAVVYELSDHSVNRLSVFSLADGRRRFEAQLPEAMRGTWRLLLTGQRVIVTSTWGITVALDVESGEEAYVID
jgi:hypothetical protein